jgi:SAM-dependent methyltransferase
VTDAEQFDQVRDFYDSEYYGDEEESGRAPSWYDRVVARRLGDLHGRRALDIACGRGDWMELLASRGAIVSGLDISQRAVASCSRRLPGADVRQGVAEELPFDDGAFDVVTCMGSLEHFLDKPKAVREMVRVSAPGAKVLLLVPNGQFLTRRVGLYGGTQQVRIKEDVLPLDAWARLFEDAGLTIEERHRDLHVLSRRWICSGRPARWPLRALQAVVLPLWPIRWQYQVHHHCVIAPAGDDSRPRG